MSKSDAGKGDTYRKVDQNKYRENYDKIFKKKVSKKHGTQNEQVTEPG